MTPIQTSTNPSTSYLQTLAQQSSYTYSASKTIKDPQHDKKKRTEIEPWKIYGNKNLKHNLLKPKVPVTIYNIQWTPPTIEARSDLVRLHHRKLTPEQQKSSVLNTLLTENDRFNLLSSRCSYSNYESRRIVYITSQQQEDKPLCSPQEMWNNLFTYKLSEISAISKPTTVKDKAFVSKIKYYKNVLLQYLNPSMTKLFMSLESGTINYEDYCTLRSNVYKLENKKLRPIKSSYFPGLRTCNNTQYLTYTKFYNPTFLLASKAFLQIRPTPARCEKLLPINGQITLQKFYEGSFQSIMELESAASSLSHIMSKISIRTLINNAIAIMEQKNILPTTSNINDLNTNQSCHIPSNSSKDIKANIQSQEQTDTTSKYKTTTSQCTTTRTVHVIQRPKIKIKIVYMGWAPKTAEQKRSLIALQCNVLSQNAAEAHMSLLSSILDEHQKNLLLRSKGTLIPYSTHRILHIHRTQPTPIKSISVSQIWQDMFIRHKESYVYTAPREPHIQKSLSFYRQQLIELLPPNISPLFDKIENFSISRAEYIMAREAALKVGKEPYNVCTDLFFPSINTLNSDIQTDLSIYAPKAFELAAKAYLASILSKPYTSQLLIGEAKDLAKQMRNGNFRSLQELERAASKLIYKYHKGSFINLLDNAAAIMENLGVLPITGNVNDPTSQYEDDDEQHDYNTDISSEDSTYENMPTIQQEDTYNTSYQLPIALPTTPLEATTELLINKTKYTTKDIPIQCPISQQITTLQLIIVDDESITSAPSITVYDAPQIKTRTEDIPEILATTSIIRNDIIDKTEDIPTCTIEEHPTSPELILVNNETCTSCSKSIQMTKIPPNQEKPSSPISPSKETPEQRVTKRMVQAITEDVPIYHSVSQQITTLQLIIADNEPMKSAPSRMAYDSLHIETKNDTSENETSIQNMQTIPETTSTVGDNIIYETQDTEYTKTYTIEEPPTSPELIIVDDEAFTPCSTSIQITKTPPDKEEPHSMTIHSTETPGRIVTRRMANATNIRTQVIYPMHNTARRTIARQKRTSRSTAITNAIITRLMSRDAAQSTRFQYLQVSTSTDQQDKFLSVLGLKPSIQ